MHSKQSCEVHHKISNLAPLNLSNTKILQFPFFALPFARTQAAGDITHFYHLDLLHVPRGSLPCVNQNCEGTTCKKNGRLQSKGKPRAAWTLIYNHLKLIKSCSQAVWTCLPGGLLSSTASHTLIFRMKARSNCSTWDSKDSELLRRQQLLLPYSEVLRPVTASRTPLQVQGLNVMSKH